MQTFLIEGYNVSVELLSSGDFKVAAYINLKAEDSGDLNMLPPVVCHQEDDPLVKIISPPNWLERLFNVTLRQKIDKARAKVSRAAELQIDTLTLLSEFLDQYDKDIKEGNIDSMGKRRVPEYKTIIGTGKRFW
jgi:hypothetical protein